MSLAEQIQRVDGGQNDTLKAILTALGVTVGAQKIDQLAALAATISPKLKPDNLNSAETNALYGLGADAVPDDVLAKIPKIINDGVYGKVKTVLGSYNGSIDVGTEQYPSIVTGSQDINIGYRPKAVFIFKNKNGDGSGRDGAGEVYVCLDGYPLMTMGEYFLGTNVLEITDDGFKITEKHERPQYEYTYPCMGIKGSSYSYVAFVE